ADFHIDSPRVVARQPTDGVEADHSYPGIELDMGAHARGAMADAALERPSAAFIHILDREAALGGRGFPRRLHHGPLLDPAAVENARLVEMDMRLNQTRHQEAT